MDEREKRIFKSARELFFRYGFKKTSLDEIISHAKVGKGAIYEFFKNKEELFKSVVLKEYDNLFNSLKELMASETDPGKMLLMYVYARIKYIKEVIVTQIAVREVFEELKYTYDQIFPINLKEVEILGSILEHGQRNNTFRLGNTEEYAKLISEIIQRFEMSWVKMKSKEAEKKIQSLFRLLLEGLLV